MSSYGEVSDGVERAYSQAAWAAQNTVIEVGCRIRELVGEIAERARTTVDEYSRPSRTMRPRIFKDGNQWCSLYGDNLQDGVAGFGDTPEDAMVRFDEEWSKP